jgi:GT2 family glycosyltransferase
MKKVDLIILHYGDIAVTKQCIKTVESKAKGYRDIILINNDPDIDLAKDIKPQTKRKIINAQKNLGFAAGVNLGIKTALRNNADGVCLLNNDVTIKNDFLTPLINFLWEQDDAGICGSLIEFSVDNKTMFDHGAHVNKKTGIGKHINSVSKLSTNPIEVDYISGCCMLIKTEVIDAVGYFDERFFMYYEDLDLCLRAKEKGFKTYVIPTAIIHHELSKSIGRKSARLIYQLVKSNIRFIKKHTEFPLRYFSLVTQIAKFSIKMPYHIFSIGRAIKDA